MARRIPGTTTDYLNVGDAAAIDITGNAGLTVACWCYLDTLIGVNSTLVGKGLDFGTQGQYHLTHDTAGVMYFRVGDAAANDNANKSGVTTGVWQHYAGTYVSGALLAYLDGVAGANVAATRSIQNRPDSLLFGARGNLGAATVINGRLAEVGIWTAALTAAEILSLARGVVPRLVRPQSLVGYWPLLGNVSPEPDLRNGSNASVVGTVAKADHPRIITPSPAIYA